MTAQFSPDDGQTWYDIPVDNCFVLFARYDAKPVKNESFTIEPITFTFHTTYVPFYYVKTALACMRYWLGEMCGGEYGNN